MQKYEVIKKMYDTVQINNIDRFSKDLQSIIDLTDYLRQETSGQSKVIANRAHEKALMVLSHCELTKK